jgi:hypothetical protein
MAAPTVLKDWCWNKTTHWEGQEGKGYLAKACGFCCPGSRDLIQLKEGEGKKV